MSLIREVKESNFLNETSEITQAVLGQFLDIAEPLVKETTEKAIERAAELSRVLLKNCRDYTILEAIYASLYVFSCMILAARENGD